ncbi:hypothetical protein HD806DRAFT_520356 [Xylariaceae sp. AK1471]|nr:hypothetical protein HD806DRAFT_520356 [Xylariaceae sp. AK1471]
MANPPFNHLGLFPQCGICTDTIDRHERTVALYGDEASTSFRGMTRPFPFPQLGCTITEVDGFLLCRRPGCAWCAGSPEFWADTLYRLWVAAAWRTPWRGASPICFPIDAARSSSLKALCGICKLPHLHKLPFEILQMIQSYSEHALIWRGALAFDLAAHISNKTASSLSTIPLQDIIYWERGNQPQVMLSPSLPPIRITVDLIGISKIERTSCQPYKGECHSSYVYMVVKEQAISECKAQFKYGFLRLELASPCPPAVWNTPNPPNLQLCRAYETKGITFFFSSHQLYGVHIHRSDALCALSSFQRIPPRRRRSALWCYLPIATQDQILVLGVRKSLNQHVNILVRMEKAGDVIVGQYMSSPAEDRYLGWHAPITLVHGEPQEGQPIPYFGAYCQTPTRSEFPKRFQTYEPKSCPIGKEACLSIASLEDLQSVEVFYDRDNRYCRGMLLYYQNDGCRAVGQCRLDVDTSKQFWQPSQICIRMDSMRGKGCRVLYNVQVDLRTDCHTHEEKGWNCGPLKGGLAFWHTHNSSFIIIEKQNSSACFSRGVLLVSVFSLQSLRFTVARALSLSGRIATVTVAVVAIEKGLVVGFGHGAVFEASSGSKLVPIDLIQLHQ